MALVLSSGTDETRDGRKLTGQQFGHLSNWRYELDWQGQPRIKELWEIEVGDGRSQIVVRDDRAYLTTGFEKETDAGPVAWERTLSIDISTGEVIWSKERSAPIHEEQETFGGSLACPQATPAIIGECLVTLGFDGRLICRNLDDGLIVWDRNLIQRDGAVPVQFGFSSSPVAVPGSESEFVVLAAGPSGGLHCMTIADGEILWTTPCCVPSYATPLPVRLGGVDQWVIVADDEVKGIAIANGRELWHYPVATSDLTNVPTPLPFGDSFLLVSGQGWQGTRCLEIDLVDEEWEINERWSLRDVQFFYSNWLVTDGLVLGCNDKFLAAIDPNSGRCLGRWRGFGDGNLIVAGDRIVVLDGRGNLHLLNSIVVEDNRTTALSNTHRFELATSRCWVPPTIHEGRILIRADNRLLCLTTKLENQIQGLANLIEDERKLDLAMESGSSQNRDPVGAIFQTFESSGQRAALAQYEEFRAAGILDIDARIELAHAAAEQQLVDVVRLILTHAIEDYPDSAIIRSVARQLLDDEQ